MTQIIVYRNPLEAMLWGSLMDGSAFAIFGIVILLGGLWVATYAAVDYTRRRILKSTYYYGRKRSAEAWIATIVTLAAAIGLHLWNVHG